MFLLPSNKIRLHLNTKNAAVEAISGGCKIMNEIPKICAIVPKKCVIPNLRGYT